MTARAIRKGFRERGMRPFSKSMINDLAKKSAGAPCEKGIESMAKSAVSAVIGERKKALANREKDISKGEAIARQNFDYGPTELRGLDRKRRREVEEKEEEKAWKADEREGEKARKAEERENRRNDREARACRGENCKSVWKSSKTWLICPCGPYHVCPKCSKGEGNPDSFRSHSEPCGAKSSASSE